MTVEEASKKYAENCYPYDEDMRQQCEYHFESGAEWQKNNLWHDLRKNPEDLPNYDVDVMAYYGEDDYVFNHRSNNPEVITEANGFCYVGVATKVIAWMEIPTFDDILEANKDVLKRLKEV